jgi:hypothetical protein
VAVVIPLDSNALAPILVIVLGIITLVKLPLLNALAIILVTVYVIESTINVDRKVISLVASGDKSTNAVSVFPETGTVYV